jgi:hypothetical protein
VKQVWDSSFVDAMIEKVEQLEEENTMLKIAFAKYLHGHRPGEEMWSEHDQKALDIVLAYCTENAE